MKIDDLLLSAIGVVFLLFSELGLADQQLIEIACRYEMKVTPAAKTRTASRSIWYFWRQPDQIQTQDADGNHGETWQRTTNGSIQYRKLYHRDKIAVEVMATDMPANNIGFDWVKISGMLSQQELSALKPVKKAKILGRTAELRNGKINGQTLQVLWLPDQGLPASIIRKDKTGTMELRLLELTPLTAARQKPVAIEQIADYWHIDAADFDDIVNDSFARKARQFSTRCQTVDRYLTGE